MFGLSQEQVVSLEVVTVNPVGKGAAVLLRQVFGDLRTAHDGLVSVGVVDGTVVSVTSSLTRGTAQPQTARLSEAQAVEIAQRDAGTNGGPTTAELVALPVPEGARSAWQVVISPSSEGEVEGYASYVDAVTGEVLLREDLVDHAADDPSWKALHEQPAGRLLEHRHPHHVEPDGHAVPARRCATPRPARPGTRWPACRRCTTNGNSARTGETRNDSTGRAIPVRTYATDPTRTYGSTWTNAWFNAKCDPASLTAPGEADLEAAMANLFAMHNRMHDWSYRLGFTEAAWNMQQDNVGQGGHGEDAEQGNAQAGAHHRRPPDFARDNANQITPPDGIAPITNMYMWQPIAGAFYAPVRRRRLRHVRHRPRVHPRHHQPHGRRPERRPQLPQAAP